VTAPAPPAPNRAVLLAAVLFVVLVVAAGASGLVAEAFRSHSERTVALDPRAGQLTIRNLIGDVHLSPSPDGLVHVRTTATHGVQEPRLVQESTASGVLLEAVCEESLANECTVAYTVELPPTTVVRVAAGSGDVIATGLAGGLDVDLDSGDVTLLDVSGSVRVATGAGDVEAARLRSDTVLVGSDAGSARIELLTAPTVLGARVDHGDVDITVPGERRYRVQAASAAGSELIAVGTDRTSPHEITVTSETGDIEIRPTLGPRRVPIPPVPPDPPDLPDPPFGGEVSGPAPPG